MIIRYDQTRKKVLFAAGSVAEVAARAAMKETIRQTAYLSDNVTILAAEKATNLVAGGVLIAGSGHNAITFGRTAFKILVDIDRGDTLCTGLCLVACV